MGLLFLICVRIDERVREGNLRNADGGEINVTSQALEDRFSTAGSFDDGAVAQTRAQRAVIFDISFSRLPRAGMPFS